MINIGLLILTTVLKVSGENMTTKEIEQINSLNEEQTLQIFGNLITVVAKNESENETNNCDAFDLYLKNHLVRIRSPLEDEKYLDFELNDLIPGNEIQGREKRDKRKGPIREILIPLLLALKYKSTVVLPLLMMTIAFVAFKGFWAGMTGLVISKVIGLKILLQSLNKPEEDQDGSADQDHVSYGFDHQSEDEIDRSYKPIVVYLHSQNQRRITPKRHRKLSDINWEYRRRQQN